MLSNDITIVIPCKNEKENIYECISFIAKQSGIVGTTVIIADCSDEEDSLDAFLKEHNPILAAAEKRTDERLTRIYEDLETYKGYGLVMEYE